MTGPFRYDDALKLSALADPSAFLGWLKLLLHQAPSGLALVSSVVSGELHAKRRFADLVWRIRLANGLEWLLHVEFQLPPREPAEKLVPMAERLLEYAVGLYLRDHLPVLSVVIYPQKTEKVAVSPLVIGGNGAQMLQFHFQSICLWKEPYEPILRLSYPFLWPLAGAMGGMTAQKLSQPVERILSSDLEDKVKGELLERLALLAGLQLKTAQIQTVFGRYPIVADLLRASDWTRSAFEQGEIQGAARGARRMAQSALEKRYGQLGQEVVEAITSADEGLLTEVVAALVADPQQPLTVVRVQLGLSPD
jgi:hypothetical protein